MASKNRMKIIPMNRDLEKYLDAVEAEAFRILDKHKLPRDIMELTVIKKKKKKKKKDQIFIDKKIPLDIYQAWRVLENTRSARIYLTQNLDQRLGEYTFCGMLAFNLSSIRDVMYLGYSSGLKVRKRLGKIGHDSDLKQYIKAAIVKTRRHKGHTDIKADDVRRLIADGFSNGVIYPDWNNPMALSESAIRSGKFYYFHISNISPENMEDKFDPVYVDNVKPSSTSMNSINAYIRIFNKAK